MPLFQRNRLVLFCSFPAPMNAYSRREARMVHRNLTSGEFGAIFMEIAVVFHCTNPMIGIHLFFQVARAFTAFSQPNFSSFWLPLLVRSQHIISYGRCVGLRKRYYFWNTDHSLFQLLCHSYFEPLRWLLDLFQFCFVLTNILPDIGVETSRLGLSETVLHRHCVLKEKSERT